MNEPTKNLIPRSAVEYICRKETVSTNPDDFTHSEMFIKYLDHDAISSFGRWQWANGFNTALVAVKCGLDKIPTIEPERKKGKWIIKDNPGTGWYRVTCSECGEDVTSTAPCIGFYPNAKVTWDYCPSCGCDMREGGENA